MSQKLPSLSSRQVVSAFKKAGFYIMPHRGKGSHIAMSKADSTYLTIPNQKTIKRGMLRGLIRQAGISVEEFLSYL
jgi:predicted RNA binding protein YcfA (HicA-like mRNA interferase family)